MSYTIGQHVLAPTIPIGNPNHSRRNKFHGCDGLVQVSSNCQGSHQHERLWCLLRREANITSVSNPCREGICLKFQTPPWGSTRCRCYCNHPVLLHDICTFDIFLFILFWTPLANLTTRSKCCAPSSQRVWHADRLTCPCQRQSSSDGKMHDTAVCRTNLSCVDIVSSCFQFMCLNWACAFVPIEACLDLR